MERVELWVRLMAVHGLYGEQMLKAALLLKGKRHITHEMLGHAGLNGTQQSQFINFPEVNIDKAWHWLDAPDNHLICADTADYPAQLKATDSFPGAFYLAGNPDLLKEPQLAVVGSRNMSWYGKQNTEQFCQTLAMRGLTITSGLALGVDGVAHRAALDAQGKTVAVLGNGFPGIYPKRHRNLAIRIIENGGAVVSEFPLGTQPLAMHFPRRNRIISGLSFGVLVTEAALRSGSLVTARCALEQGREVFAIPGSIHSPGSEGPHWLIQEGAVTVTSPEDILSYAQNELNSIPLVPKVAKYSSDQGAIPLPFPGLLANVGDEVTSVDVVAERAGQPVPVVVAQLLELELAGWIAAVPGGYVRLRRASHVRRTNLSV